MVLKTNIKYYGKIYQNKIVSVIPCIWQALVPAMGQISHRYCEAPLPAYKELCTVRLTATETSTDGKYSGPCSPMRMPMK